ncbi:MAG: sulfotransferase [Betaproteobacteria bacterium]|nr:sulfotransferase [Betaproteobacteria bacterium]
MNTSSPTKPDATLRVAVISSGRSGTSLLSRILHEVLGIDFGPESEHLPRNHDNPDGYFENLAFLEFNDRILAAVGGSVISPPPIDALESLPASQLNALVDEARALLTTYSAHRPYFGWKDPRLSLTLPIWARAQPDLIPVIPFRDPRAVTLSIVDQVNIKEAHAMSMWVDYYQRIFRYTAAMPSLLVSFDALLKTPLRVTQNLAAHLKCPFDLEEANQKLASIIKPKQARHSITQETAATPLLDPRTETLFKYLTERYTLGLPPDHQTLAEIFALPPAGAAHL